MARTTSVYRIQNVYGDFLRSFRVFLDRFTRNLLNKIEWNYGSKTLEYYYMMDGHESFEYPVAIIDIQDIQPVDGVSPIARNANLQVNMSPHQVTVCENKTKEARIIMDKRWVNLMFTVTINTEDVTSLLNLHDMTISQLPLNFLFYDYEYWNYIEVTDFVRDWDFENDDIDNVYLQLDGTFRYEPDVKYNHSSEDFFKTEERDRIAAGDKYPDLEGRRYFTHVRMEPILKITSITKQTDKDQNLHSLQISFEARMEVPNLLIWIHEWTIESIEIVIDTVSKYVQEYPILIDMPENFLTNKNIQRGILLSADNFHFPSDQGFDPNDPNPPDPSVYPYLEVGTDINLDLFVASLWAVEDVTETSSSRFFIPLKHAKVEKVKDPNDPNTIIATRFYFVEMDWFRKFNLGGQFNFLKLILFNQD